MSVLSQYGVLPGNEHMAAAGGLRALAGKRLNEEDARQLAGAAVAGTKKGRAAFEDITNRDSGATTAACKGMDDAALRVPGTTGNVAAQDASAPTPSYLIKRIRFSDSYAPPSDGFPTPQREDWIDIDADDRDDPMACTQYVNEMFTHLRAAETKKRPSTSYIETVQQDINAGMRGILVDWLVEVAQEYKLHSDTLYLTVAYLDRYLSVAAVPRNELQLVGVACMLIASKYEEIYAPTVEDFCYITDHTYSREQLLACEDAVLSALGFEVTSPTPKTFVRRFLKAAAAGGGAHSHLELLANYLLELTLSEYGMLQFLPSTIAASAVLAARYLLGEKAVSAWTPTLSHYTGYSSAQLKPCAQQLHGLFLRAYAPAALPAVKEKYSHDILVTYVMNNVEKLPDALFQ